MHIVELSFMSSVPSESSGREEHQHGRDDSTDSIRHRATMPMPSTPRRRPARSSRTEGEGGEEEDEDEDEPENESKDAFNLSIGHSEVSLTGLEAELANLGSPSRERDSRDTKDALSQSLSSLPRINTSTTTNASLEEGLGTPASASLRRSRISYNETPRSRSGSPMLANLGITSHSNITTNANITTTTNANGNNSPSQSQAADSPLTRSRAEPVAVPSIIGRVASPVGIPGRGGSPSARGGSPFGHGQHEMGYAGRVGSPLPLHRGLGMLGESTGSLNGSASRRGAGPRISREDVQRRVLERRGTESPVGSSPVVGGLGVSPVQSGRTSGQFDVSTEVEDEAMDGLHSDHDHHGDNEGLKPRPMKRQDNPTYDGVMAIDPEPQPRDPPRPTLHARAYSESASAFLGADGGEGGRGTDASSFVGLDVIDAGTRFDLDLGKWGEGATSRSTSRSTARPGAYSHSHSYSHTASNSYSHSRARDAERPRSLPVRMLGEDGEMGMDMDMDMDIEEARSALDRLVDDIDSAGAGGSRSSKGSSSTKASGSSVSVGKMKLERTVVEVMGVEEEGEGDSMDVDIENAEEAEVGEEEGEEVEGEEGTEEDAMYFDGRKPSTADTNANGNGIPALTLHAPSPVHAPAHTRSQSEALPPSATRRVDSAVPPPPPPKDNIRNREQAIMEKRRELRRREEQGMSEDDDDEDAPRSRGRLDVPGRRGSGSKRKGRRSLSVGDAEDVERRSGMVDGGNKVKSQEGSGPFGLGATGGKKLLGVKREDVDEADLRDSIERELMRLGGAAKNVGVSSLVSGFERFVLPSLFRPFFGPLRDLFRSFFFSG